MDFWKTPLLFLTLSLISQSSQQDLNSTFCNSTLPSGRSALSGVYDGDRNIYLFGGYNLESVFDDILRYDIFSDKVESVGRLPSADYGKSCVLITNNNIICLGGGRAPGNQDILLFDPTSNLTSVIGRWEMPSEKPGVTFLPVGNIILSFGNFWVENRRGIFQFDLRNNVSLFWDDVFDFEVQYAAPVFDGKNVRLFYGKGSLDLLELDPLSFSYQKFDETFNATTAPSTPAFLSEDGKFLYAFSASNSPFYGRHPAILKVNLEEEESFSWHLIDGLSECFSNQCGSPAVVFVPEMKRLYVFGGYGTNWDFKDEIRYIDLETIM